VNIASTTHSSHFLITIIVGILVISNVDWGQSDFVTYTRVYTQKFVHGMIMYIQARNSAIINRLKGFLYTL
jgi:hypothetical protein